MVRKFLNRMSIKNFLMGTVSILAVVLAVLSVNNFISTRGAAKEISRMASANELADGILEATGYEGKERANTALALSETGTDTVAVQKIHEFRDKGDAAVKKSYALARSIIEMGGSTEALREALEKAESDHRELESGRRTADSNFGRTVRDYSAQEWNNLIGSYIDANADLRMKTFTSSTSKEAASEALRMNLVLKQAVYLQE
jgi:hypothetical protein